MRRKDHIARARQRRISWLPWLRFSSWLSLASGIAYIGFRTCLLSQAQAAGFTMWMAIISETSVVLLRVLSLSRTLFLTRNIHIDAPRSAVGGEPDLPRVDIFITYCGESLNVLMDTVRATVAQDYPRSLFRIIILDDSASSEASALIARLESEIEGQMKIYYTTRGATVRTHSKAANLNHGLHFLHQLDEDHAQYLAVLDVDMIPERHWLGTVMAYILNDHEVGLANPFQNFYNLPSSDRLGHNDLWRVAHTTLVLQDLAGKSSCTGTGFVVRREALNQIGGFPTESLSEDFLLSIRLTAKGWKVCHVPGQLQWGMAPESFSGMIKQRQRLTLGHLSNTLHICVEHAHEYTFGVRILTSLWATFQIASACIWSLNMVLLPAMLLSGRPLLQPDHLRTLSALAFFDFVSQSSYEICASSYVDFQSSLLGSVSTLWISPFILGAIMRSHIIPKILGGSDPRFDPSGKLSIQSRAEAHARRRRKSCLKLIIWDGGAWLHLVVFMACLAGFIPTMRQLFSVLHSNDFRRSFMKLVQSIMWPPLFSLWLFVVTSVWTPIAYGLRPPTAIPREKFLRPLESKGPVYPSEEAKRKASERAPQTLWYFVAIYHALAFCLVMKYV